MAGTRSAVSAAFMFRIQSMSGWVTSTTSVRKRPGANVFGSNVAVTVAPGSLRRVRRAGRSRSRKVANSSRAFALRTMLTMFEDPSRYSIEDPGYRSDKKSVT